MKTFDGKECWGLTLSIDLQHCNPDYIRSEAKLKEFLIAIVKEIDMKAFGDPICVRFGANPVVTGYSIAQLIETSLISGHFAEDTNAAYIDIFSCKEFDPDVAVAFCANFFEAASSHYNYNFRGKTN